MDEKMYLYFVTPLTFLLFMFVCFRKLCFTTDDPFISNPYLNQIELDNGRHLTNINSDQQRCSVQPLSVLNDLEYEDIYNMLLTQPHLQPYNAEQTSRINIFTPQARIVPLCSSLNYVELNASNVTSFSRSSYDDPPPSYDECMASSL
ncbi:uncharacterized protein LOC112592632 [Melanaphis sacchari]|uniref:uncharacterized protein LOC112592632 n=1 Tax=Melanaphis sacchari TaxID=742174 RepID=UPI000DC13534|nr:uncharacterized protein LOC112592632 [Melanaphis sacchari]